MKPGSKIKSKSLRFISLSTSLTISSVKKADIVIGALRILIFCFVIGVVSSLIIG
jgi:hypothetical protein